MAVGARMAVLAGVVAALLLSAAARADLDVGTYAPDFEAKDWLNTDEPISLIDLRGMVVVVVFWVSWFEGGEFILPELSIVNSREVRQRGYYVIGLTDSDKTKVEKLVKEKRIFFPIGAGSKSMEEYKITKYPSLVIIDPLGKISWSGAAFGKDNEISKALEKVFTDNPPFKTHPDEVIYTQRQLAEARQALREGDIRESFEAAERAIEHTVFGDPLRAKCQDVLDLIESLGRDMLARSLAALDDKRYEDAVRLLRDIRRDFIGLEVARTARKRLELMKKRYPEVAKIVERESEASRAELALMSAIEVLRARQFGEAYVKLEDLAKEFPDTDAAAKAQTVLDRMNKNEGLMGYVRDHKAESICKPLLTQAGNFARSGQNSKARELYRRILDEFGDTVWADEAARRMALLP